MLGCWDASMQVDPLADRSTIFQIFDFLMCTSRDLGCCDAFERSSKFVSHFKFFQNPGVSRDAAML